MRPRGTDSSSVIGLHRDQSQGRVCLPTRLPSFPSAGGGRTTVKSQTNLPPPRPSAARHRTLPSPRATYAFRSIPEISASRVEAR